MRVDEDLFTGTCAASRARTASRSARASSADNCHASARVWRTTSAGQWRRISPVRECRRLIASGHTADPGFLRLAAIGSRRMFLELLFKMVVPGYAPGKFRSMTGPFAEWMTRRRHFLLPYVATWALYLVLSSHVRWF